MTAHPWHTLNQALIATLNEHAGRICIRAKLYQRYQNISYRWFAALTFKLVKYFHQHGIKDGQRVALATENCIEWLAVYTATILAGGVIVPIRTSLPPKTLLMILADSGCSIAVLEATDHIEAVSATFGSDSSSHSISLPHLKQVLTLNHKNVSSPLLSLQSILTEAAPATAEEQSHLAQQAEATPPDQIAALHYRAGSDGHHRGAIFSQKQLMLTQQYIATWFTFEEDDVGFTIVSWSEFYSLEVSLHYFLSGITNVLADSYETVTADMRQTSPTIMLATPLNYQNFYAGYSSWVIDKPKSTQVVFRWALAKGKEYQQAGASASAQLRQEYDRADLTFFSNIRGGLGGRIRKFYSTGAVLSHDISEFFAIAGLPITKLYSLNEGGGFPAINYQGAKPVGTYGKIAPNFEMQLANDHEIMVRSNTMPRRYWQSTSETDYPISDDGWLYSGDIGFLDDEGYIYLTGVKPHLLVLANGYRILPTLVEQTIAQSPFIVQAAVVGDGKAYLSAMLVLDIVAIADHLQVEVEQIRGADHPQLKEQVEKIIGTANQALDHWEQIREYSLLDQQLSATSGELTPSMKISRHVVAARYSDTIAAMYPVEIQLEAKHVEQVFIEPERLRYLLEKESILDAWMKDAGIEFLFQLARQKQIDAPSMVHISDTAASIAQMEHEEKPLSTALIVGDPARIARILPPSQVQLLTHDNIRRMRKIIVTLAKLVDGFVLGYLIDKHGYVRGIQQLEVDLPLEDNGNFLLGPQFRRHAAISKLCDAIVFFVPAGGRQVRIFAEGQLVGRYANGDWSPENTRHVDDVIIYLANERAYDIGLMRRILRCAFRMSEENLGAIFLVGDADTILKNSDNSEINSFATIVNNQLSQLSDQELINFAKQDGATVIDHRGEFRGCMVLLRPDAETRAEIGPDKGARHSSAAKMSAETECLAITVSQDGPITLYDRGNKILSL
ncbi:AMP-binding protein [Anaerolineales bacterium HSG6]|nr:AMP-binding protein [Anaerolineales bacterium HSG6]